jgi:transposase-like protein
MYRRRRFDAEIIELGVRWYITYRLSYRDLVAMMAERGIVLSPTTIHRWVIRYVPEFEKRWNRFARHLNTSWRFDETYIKVRGKWNYLYRAVDRLIEQDHRAIKRRCASMTGFKSFGSPAITLAGIERAHRIRKRRHRNFGSLKQIWERALA